MRVQVSIRHGHLGIDTQDKVKAKLEKLARFHDRIASVEATVDVADQDRPQVEVAVVVEGVPPFVARAEGTQLLGAIETASHRLEEQLRRHKEKVIDSHRDNYRRNRNGAPSESPGLGEDDTGAEQ